MWKVYVGLFCLVYALVVGYFAFKKSPVLIKLVKMKLGKNMTDKAALTTCYVMACIMLVAGIVLLVLQGVLG